MPEARGPDAQPTRARPLPRWFDDAKLGVFVHWGPYSVPGWAEPAADIQQIFATRGPRFYFRHNPYAEWYVNTMRIAGSPAQRHHRETWGADFAYAQFGERFEQAAAQLDPTDWAALFGRSGARYTVLTTKHMDGFALWPSAHAHPRRPGWGARRDLVGAVAQAMRAEGLRLGLYYCGGFDTTFEERVIRTLGDCVLAVPQSEAYARHCEAQLRELIERYRPDVLWNDIGYPVKSDLGALLDAYYRAVPDGVANDRWVRFSLPEPGTLRHRLVVAALPHGDAIWPLLPRRLRRFNFPPSPFGDYQTPEYTSPDDVTPYKWETARGLGPSFGYNAREGEAETLSLPALVHLLVDVVSMNGNLLIGVGPMADGTIPPLQRARLEGLGAWLGVHGEAIFATRPWQRAAAETGDGRPLRFTRGTGALFATVLAAPRPGELVLPLRPAPGTRVELLGLAAPLAYRECERGLAVTLPPGVPGDAPAHSLKLEPEPRLAAL
ncbi:alpha-L-fucosidase [Myxococcota bacterium]|nr:alpha-L-fucosidase [Myxococcota bacterium]MCZ7617603.1 alpha-L-fucosidase [Myxococcota bacterium]